MTGHPLPAFQSPIFILSSAHKTFPAKALLSTFAVSKMIEDLSYSTVSLVLQSWEKARAHKDFEERLGVDTLLRYVGEESGMESQHALFLENLF